MSPLKVRSRLSLLSLVWAQFIMNASSIHAQEIFDDGTDIAKPTAIKLAARKKKSHSTAADSAESSSTSSGRGTPKAEVGGYFSYATVNQEESTDAGSDSSSGSTMTISGSYLMILQKKYGVGPTLTYSSSSQGDTASSNYGLGGTGKYYFADFREQMIPFASFTLQISGRSQTTSVTNPTTGASTSDTSSGSGFGFVLGGGLHYMLAKALSVTPELQYYSNSTSASGVTFKESGIRLLAGFVIFF